MQQTKLRLSTYKLWKGKKFWSSKCRWSSFPCNVCIMLYRVGS